MQIVFVHGLGQDPSSWDGVLACMEPPPGARCPALFQMMEGQAAGYENLLKAFCAYCDQLPAPLHLCGLSLGAVLALQYAATHPGRMASLALIGGQYKASKALIRLQNGVFRLMGAKAFAKTGLAKADMIALSASLAGLDLRRDLARVACPTLVLCGEKDRPNQKAARSLAQGIAGARLELIKGAGHEANADAPQALAQALSAFYQSLGQ